MSLASVFKESYVWMFVWGELPRKFTTKDAIRWNKIMDQLGLSYE